ncbi:MAG TPA: hypothetical protein VJA66_02105, partial [Thermoanaerobaculia bacterium]
ELHNSNSRGARRQSASSAAVVIVAAAIFARGLPNLAEYTSRLRETHSSSAIAGGAGALAAALGVLFLGIWKWPKATAVVLGIGTALLIVISRYALAAAVAAGVITLTLLAGDGICRRLRGRDAKEGEISTSIAAGVVTLGIFLMLFGEAGLARPFPLTVAAVFFVLTCVRQVPPLARRVRAQAAEMAGLKFSAIEALWLSVVVAGIGASFLGALRPDVFFDSVAYHFPEIRDFATRGRVAPLPNIFETSLWHSYETFLGGAFLAGGERAVRLLHFFVGLAAFASAATLARRLRPRFPVSLVLLALAAVPVICAQLKETLADLPAALLLTAAAAELIPREGEHRRGRLAGFLFGGAITTKIFALWGGVALLILLPRRPRAQGRTLLAFALFAAIPLLPWLAWSQARFGFFLSPYSDPVVQGSTPHMGPAGAAPRPWTRTAPSGAVEFFRLPYDRTFESVWFGREGSGVLGLIPLLLLLGLIGWNRRTILLFLAAAFAAVVPWYVLSAAKLISPSIRFLIPLYPLYAVFGALGLSHATGNFRGRIGAAAGIGVSLLAIGFPAQFFGAALDGKMALGRVSTERGLTAYLPAYPLWKDVRNGDRVLLLGEWDRFHCPAEFVIRDIDLPAAGDDARAWEAELRRLHVTKIVYRADTRHLQPVLDALGDCIELVARSGPARLYRVKEDATCLADKKPAR